jgi:hypothetical protein
VGGMTEAGSVGTSCERCVGVVGLSVHSIC